MTKYRIKKNLETIKAFLNENLSNPFLCKFKVKYHDWGFKAIIIDCCELWKFTISIDDDYINISTRRGRGFGQYDLEQVIEILDYKEDIIDMLFKED